MNKVLTRIILIFLLISIFPFMRMCEEYPASYVFPTVAVDGNPLESENYNYLGIIINTLVAGGLIFLFYHLIKTKKIDVSSKSVRWGIRYVIIYLALYLILILLAHFEPDDLEWLVSLFFFITHFGLLLLGSLLQDVQTNMLYPVTEDLSVRLGFIIGILVYYFAGYGIRKLVDFIIRKKNKE